MVFPNLHGHGGMVQFEYKFPSAGVYNVGIIFGQQTGSPNFIVEPKVIKQITFPVNVAPAQSSPIPKGAHVDVRPIKVQS